jgi:anti-sigma B factor antagonist
MRLHEYRDRQTDVLELGGEIDLHYAPVLRTLLTAKANCQCASLLLDMSGVRFIDSSGLAVLIEYLRMAANFGGRFCIAGVGEQLAPIFQVVHLDSAIAIFADTAEAKEALAHDAVPAPSHPLFASAA